jgi:nitrogen fixation NifU-like protein
MAIYSKEVMRHFTNPQNVGKMRNYDGLGKAGNLTCGDIMYLYLKIGKDKKGREIIKDIKFETFGCAVAIANTSLLTTMVKGKTLEEALKITKEDLLKKFGQVPIIHCSLLAVDALGEAIYDYLSKQKRHIPKELQERHERAERDKNIIEKRHGELAELEEKLHKK